MEPLELEGKKSDHMVEVEGNSRTQVPCVGGMEKNWGRALSRKGIRKK